MGMNLSPHPHGAIFHSVSMLRSGFGTERKTVCPNAGISSPESIVIPESVKTIGV